MPLVAMLIGISSESNPMLAEPSDPRVASFDVIVNVRLVEDVDAEGDYAAFAGTERGIELLFTCCTTKYVESSVARDGYHYDPGLVVLDHFTWAKVEQALSSLVSALTAGSEADLLLLMARSFLIRDPRIT